MQQDNLSVIILASSYINRMKGHGPPSLFKDAYGRSILEHQINIIANNYPKAEIVVISGLWSDQVAKLKNNRFRIVENQLFETTNEVEDTRLALNNIYTNNVLILPGDLYFNTPTLLNLPDKSFTIYDNKNQLHNVEIGITIVNQDATALSFDLSNKYTGITFIDSTLFPKFKSICLDRSKSKLFLFEVINSMVLADLKIRCHQPNNMKIIKATSQQQLLKMKEIAFK